ncbi:hypothetical protein [Streptomyces longispororuber]|uniref:hypothetical protein n=1 Tax=Streptomyces longispororuber TaxID=68230 RepID=UPI00167E9CC0|nr:hypothetical protein [Streptomyces longispororuber]
MTTNRRLSRLGPLAALTGMSGLAALAGAPAASADTNTSTEKSTMLCNIVLLSPGADMDGCSHIQVSGQNMTKQNTPNSALVDYAKVESLTSLLPWPPHPPPGPWHRPRRQPAGRPTGHDQAPHH